MPHALIIADDLTGAADTGAQFARRGWRTLLALQPGAGAEADVLVMSTDSRNLPDAESAGAAVRAALTGLDQADFLLVYKKIDSTLRGHPAAELAELMAELGDSRALIAPAFPAQGRTTYAGHVFVQGVPLEQTSFGAGPFCGDLRRRFGRNTRPGLLDLEGVQGGISAMRNAMQSYPGMWIADAENGEDLRNVARAGLALGLRVLCGSAGLADALADALGDNLAAGAGAELPQPGRGALLAVVGSLHPATAALVSAACRAGAALITPGEEFYGVGEMAGMAETASRVMGALRQGGRVILATDVNEGQEGADVMVARKLGEVAALGMENVAVAGLFLSGGDTARAVCKAVGCTRLWLGGEVEPGMPWARLGDGRWAELPVVTKAGGFGGEDAIIQALNFLAGESHNLSEY
jgi:D-threonate/D-erythronate kinase